METYLARPDAAMRQALDQEARSAADAMTREGNPIDFQGSVHLPEDETCFFTFVTSSAREAVLVAQRAGLHPLRVVEAIPSHKETP